MEYTGETLARFVKHYAFLSFGLSLMALGITFSIKGKLGTSPISSLPYVLSVLSPLTVGQASIVMHLAFIAFQIALLRRRFAPEQFVQLPVSLLFGYLMDGWMLALRRESFLSKLAWLSRWRRTLRPFRERASSWRSAASFA